LVKLNQNNFIITFGVAEYDLNAPWHVLFRVFRKVFGRVGLKGKFLKFF
jgi:hypothetical protein